ncbi:MAG: hypothetical protein FWF82_05290 [Oscillospiraceae bacterium]|nr:hypothetical protein [Oscillospiraceae bacterium]
MKRIISMLTAVGIACMMIIGASGAGAGEQEYDKSNYAAVKATIDYYKNLITFTNANPVAAGDEQLVLFRYYVKGPEGVRFYSSAPNARLPDSAYAPSWNPVDGYVRWDGTILGGDDGLAAGHMLLEQEFEGATLENFHDIIIIVETGQDMYLAEVEYIPSQSSVQNPAAVKAAIDYSKGTITFTNAKPITAGESQIYLFNYSVEGPDEVKFWTPRVSDNYGKSYYKPKWDITTGTVQYSVYIDGGSDGIPEGEVLLLHEFKCLKLENFHDIRITVEAGQGMILTEVEYNPPMPNERNPVAIKATIDYSKGLITFTNVNPVAAGREEAFPIFYHIEGPEDVRFYASGSAGNIYPDWSGWGWNSVEGIVEGAVIVRGGDNGVPSGVALCVQEFEGATLENFHNIKITVGDGYETILTEVEYIPPLPDTTESESATENTVNSPNTGVGFGIVPVLIVGVVLVVSLINGKSRNTEKDHTKQCFLRNRKTVKWGQQETENRRINNKQKGKNHGQPNKDIPTNKQTHIRPPHKIHDRLQHTYQPHTNHRTRRNRRKALCRLCLTADSIQCSTWNICH